MILKKIKNVYFFLHVLLEKLKSNNIKLLSRTECENFHKKHSINCKSVQANKMFFITENKRS